MDTSDMLEDDFAKAFISIAEIKSEGKKDSFLFCLAQTIAFAYNLTIDKDTIYWTETHNDLDQPYFIVGMQNRHEDNAHYFGFYGWNFDGMVKGLFK